MLRVGSLTRLPPLIQKIFELINYQRIMNNNPAARPFFFPLDQRENRLPNLANRTTLTGEELKAEEK